MRNAIEIKNLSYSYNGDQNQIDNINLTIKEGEVVVITGPSGSGKSTLSKVINGLIPHFYGGNIEGSVKLFGQDLSELATWERSFLVGNVFQDPRSQFFSNEVAGEIAFGCENYGLSHKEIIKRVNLVSEEFSLTKHLYDKVRILSYGMRQRVAIASAQALKPQIYVMDEPSANLDMVSALKFAQTIKILKDSGKTIFIAEHRLFYLDGIADRILYFKDGKICDSFTCEEMRVFSEEKNINYGLRRINLDSISFSKNEQIIQCETILKLENINKKFAKNHILKNITISFSKGEIVAIVGPNSSGKSTLGKLLAGLEKEDNGNIFYNNKKTKAGQRLGKIWYVSQNLDSQLFCESVLDELITGKKITDKIVKIAEEVLISLDLYKLKERHPSTLSGGQKQRLALAVALMNKAQVIILDEPTSGLDAKNMRKVSKQIRELAKKGHIILMITHDIECAMNTCKRFIYLKDGEIIEDREITSTKDLINMCIEEN